MIDGIRDERTFSVSVSGLSVVLSSRNRKKSQEIAEILAPHGISVQSIADFPAIGEIEEDGATFADNAAKKATIPAAQLGRWVIDTALTQIAAWQDAGVDLPVSVNISGFHLQQAGFLDELRALLAAHPNVPRGYLELEVLESSALEDIALVSAVGWAVIGLTLLERTDVGG